MRPETTIYLLRHAPCGSGARTTVVRCPKRLAWKGRPMWWRSDWQHDRLWRYITSPVPGGSVENSRAVGAFFLPWPFARRSCQTCESASFPASVPIRRIRGGRFVEAWTSPDEATPVAAESNVRAQSRGLAVGATPSRKRHVGSHVVVATHGNLLTLIPGNGAGRDVRVRVLATALVSGHFTKLHVRRRRIPARPSDLWGPLD
jgi:hypothetical protein